MVEVAPGVLLATWTTTRHGADSPPMVLLHGGPGLWSSHDDLVDLLDDVAVVHTYDQRGCGRSTPTREQSIEHSVADLEALRQHWDQTLGGHQQWVVVGHSFGADLALAYAATHPDRVLAVGYLAGRGIGDRTAEKTEQARRLGDRRARLGVLDANHDRCWDEEVEWRQLRWATDYADLDTGREHSLLQAATYLEINLYANHLLRCTDEQLITWAAAVECPVHVIHGSDDPRPIANVLELAAHLETVRKRVVQGAGHFPWVEQPDETAGLLVELVRAGRHR